MTYFAQHSTNVSVLSSLSSLYGLSKRKVPDNDDGLYRLAVDFTDVEQLLVGNAKDSGFKCVLQDVACGISLYSRPVEGCSMHLMRADAVLPCTPAALLTYLDQPIRGQWDNYLAELRCVRVLERPQGAVVGEDDSVDVGRGVARRLKVALQYMAVDARVPHVRGREFEIVVAEEVRRDESAWLKAFSTQPGYIKPLDCNNSKYVRAFILLFGVMARPLLNREGREECYVSCVALVHPMGIFSSVLFKLVLVVQLNALRNLRRYMLQHSPKKPGVRAVCGGERAGGSGSASRGKTAAEVPTRSEGDTARAGKDAYCVTGQSSGICEEGGGDLLDRLESML